MSIFNELKRRNVIRVALLYVVGAWLLMQFADVAISLMQLPDWVGRFTLFVVLLGLPFALFFAWAYELTPEGLKREKDVDRSQSVTQQTGRKLDYIVIALLAIAVIYFIFDKITIETDTEAPAAVQESESTVDSLSIAVLPFVNMSADPENEYFADGLSEELLNALAQVQNLKVAGRTSSFYYKDKNEDLRKIGRTLGVANILEGSVRRQGDSIRVTAQLVRADDGFHLWSDNYDRTLDDVFAIQDDIAESVTRALNIVLDDANRERMHNAGVRDVDAFIAYQKGLELSEIGHGTAELVPTLKRGNVYLDEAIALVPEFSAAYYLKSDYYSHIIMELSFSDSERSEALQQLRDVYDAAFEHAQDSLRRAFIDVDRTLFSDDWRAMSSRIEKALDQEGCADAVWFEVVPVFGYADGQLVLRQRQLDCDPLDLFTNLTLMKAALWAQQPDLALAATDNALKTLGQHTWISAFRALALQLLGRPDEARKAAAKVDTEDPYYGMAAGVIEAAEGNTDNARQMLTEWISQHEDRGYGAAIAYAAMGDREATNRVAAYIDGQPGGPALLVSIASSCLCGAPFDLEATPNLARLLQEADTTWPPPTIINFPEKDW